jgi:hypothetical protein
MRSPDYKGRMLEKFRWTHFRFEWGRYCYETDAWGETLNKWWEWETEMGNRITKES